MQYISKVTFLGIKTYPKSKMFLWWYGLVYFCDKF